ncbi:hypothetical protein I4U23_004055 [Adineta vaga]|nr:hypothetical protein I4U23_004055 [Adineta vaga]
MSSELLELYREGSMVYKVLTPKHRDATAAVLARAFCTEPVCTAIADIRPELMTTFLDWFQFVDFWMDHCSTNGLSVIAIDEENHCVAGAFIVRDLFYFPPGFLETYSDDKNSLTPWMHFLLHLDLEAQKVYPSLSGAKLGDVCDLWFLGVHPDYRGRKIANHLMRLAVPLVKRAGFKFATIEATSSFTSKAALFNNFKPLVHVKAKDWLWKEKPLYVNAPLPHGIWTFWIKDLL